MNMNASVQVSPNDPHNRELVAHVHPPDWVNPKPAPRYNLVVIGAGTAGLVTAAGAAGLGAKVALVERHLMGGDCLNTGCVPSKALLRSAKAAQHVKSAHKYGVHVPEGVAVDFGAVMERMREIRSRISKHDSAKRFKELGVDVFLGQARFTGGDTVQVGNTELRYKRAVICTGARALHPPIEGLQEAGFLTNESVFSLTELPRRLAVIGGGPIGCELAQAFLRFGAEVTLFHDRDHLLDREDADAAEIVQKRMIAEGLNLVLQAKIARVEKAANAKVLHYESQGETKQLEVDEILVGAGRKPNVEDMNLEQVGVQYDLMRGVQVNDQLQTANSNIYAAGDVCMQYKFTHAADFAARIVIQNALFMGRKKLSALQVPWCTYTEPEIAHVGHYEHTAQEQGIEIDTYTRYLRDVDRAICDGEEEGFVKIHTQKGKDTILGCTIVAEHAGDMISEVSVAMAGGIGLGKLAGVIHPYPTQAEAIRQLGDAYNRTRLSPMLKKIFQKWLAWTR